MLLLATTTAFAHYPHDVGYWLAVSPDPAVTEYATALERIDLDLLGRSDNGLDWSARLIQSTSLGETWAGAFLRTDRLVLAAGHGGLLTSDDAGDSFAPAPGVDDTDMVDLVASPAVGTDGTAFAAGDDGVWRTTDGGDSWEKVLPAGGEPFTDLDLSPDYDTDHRVCVMGETTLRCSTDGGDHWNDGVPPANLNHLSVGASARVWGVVDGDGLWKSDDDGGTWTQIGFAGTALGTVSELEDGLVLVAEELRSEWRSTDGGTSWAFQPVDSIADYQTHGETAYFDYFSGPDGAIYLTCWNGIARSDDRGLTYTWLDTERPINDHTWASPAATTARSGPGSAPTGAGRSSRGRTRTRWRTSRR